MTFNTHVVPKSCKHFMSAASRLFPIYKNGKIFDAGCESISANDGEDADGVRPLDDKPDTSVSSHKSLYFLWNSLWPPVINRETNN